MKARKAMALAMTAAMVGGLMTVPVMAELSRVCLRPLCNAFFSPVINLHVVTAQGRC